MSRSAGSFKHERKLLGEMLAQRDVVGDERLEVDVVVRAGAALTQRGPARGVAGAAAATTGFSRSRIGIDVVVVGIVGALGIGDGLAEVEPVLLAARVGPRALPAW